MKTTLMIASAVMICAYPLPSIAAQPPSSVLQSLPGEVQKAVDDLRAGCREYLGGDGNQSWVSPLANPVHSVSSGDEGLEVFTVSGAQAVMVNDLELCGGQCLRGANCSNRGSYQVAIYVRSGRAWRKALDTEAVEKVFLRTDELKQPPAFEALVLNVFGGNKDCPTHDASVQEDGESFVFPAGKQSCAAVVKWDGTKFTYRPLTLIGARAADKAEFIFSGEAVTSARFPGQFINLRDGYSISSIKSKFPSYRVEISNECDGICILVIGNSGSIQIFGHDDTHAITAIKSWGEGTMDIAGNKIDTPLIDALGAIEAKCVMGEHTFCRVSSHRGSLVHR